MNNLEQAARLALELRQLAEKFSEGWHDGIKIDASDVMLLLDAANALEQQAEPAAIPGAIPLAEVLARSASMWERAEAMRRAFDKQQTEPPKEAT